MPAKSPLPPQWELPVEIRARFGERAGKQRCMVEDDHLLLVLHAPPKADENERVARFYWRKPDGTWLSNETSGGAATIGKHLDEFQALLEKIDRTVDSATLARDYFAVMSHLAPLLRSARNLHATLQEARTAIATPELITWRDRAYENERTAELLYEDAKNGLDFATARRAEQQSEASHRMEVAAHRLNLLAAFFFPLATLTSVFGVNLLHGFELMEPPIPFLTLIGVGVLLGMLLTIFVSWNMPTAEKLAKSDPYQKRL
jgi:CorA-like Mg2+ transporter protein